MKLYNSMRAGAVAAITSIGLAASADAMTVTLYSGNPTDEGVGIFGTVVCSIDCWGFDYDTLVSRGSPGNSTFTFTLEEGKPGWGSKARTLDTTNPTEANMANLFNAAFAAAYPDGEELGFDKDSVLKTEDQPDEPTLLVATATRFFWIKDATHLWLLQTASEEKRDFTFTFFHDKDGAKVPSNFGSDGSIAPIPLPGAGFLLLGAAGGVGWLKRRARLRNAA